MSSRPLIAHVVYRLAIGGLENGLVNLLNRMPADRFRHTVVCLAGFTEFRRRIERDDVEIYSVDKQPGKDFGAYLRMWRLLRRLRPALVHTRNLGTIDMQWIALAARVPCRVHGEHGWEAADPNGLGRRALRIRRFCRRAIHRYIAMSQDISAWLKATVGVPAAHIEQIYNGVDIERFRPDGPLPADLPWQGAASSFTVGTVGRLDRVKNQLALLAAFARLVAESPAGRRADFRLLLAGEGPMADELRARAVELRIDDLVWMAGAREDVPQLMRALDVFVLPSMNEGISNTILEAMSSGRPVIAARVGGNPELIQDGVTGLLYDDRDPDGLAQALRRYRDTPGLAASHGAAGRARVGERFSIQAMVNGYTDFYGRLLNT